MTDEVGTETKKVRRRQRGDPKDGLKEVLGPPLISRIPAEDIRYWNYLSRRIDLGFNTAIELARSVIAEFTAAAPWTNPAVRNDWRWLKSKLVTPGSESGYAQFNLVLPVSERAALKELVERLAASGHDVTVSSFIHTVVNWTVHYRYPRGGPEAPAQKPYSPQEFAVSVPSIELPPMHVTEAKARKILAALGDTAPVTVFELPRRLVTAIAN